MSIGESASGSSSSQISRGARGHLGQVGVLPVDVREDGRPIGGKFAQDAAELVGFGLGHGGSLARGQNAPQ